MSVQFNGKEFTFTQPDGSHFDVRGFGDQHQARFETLDGYTVVRNPHSGFFEIATLSDSGDELQPLGALAGEIDPDSLDVNKHLSIDPAVARANGLEAFQLMGGNRRCEQRRQERKLATRFAFESGVPHLAPPKRQTVGDFVGLCLLIDFPDQPGTIPQSSVADFCNKEGYTGFGNNGSVYDYFFENSLGRLKYKNIITSYYRAQNPKSHYTDPAIRFGTRARQLIKEALDNLKASGFDFSQMTRDSQGFVYAMNIYYSGSVVNNWSEGLWPHAWSLADSYLAAPGIKLFDYQFTAMGSELSLGTFCHENGHMLCDYPDLYDYGYESSGVGVYCLMCGGGSNNEKNPAHISAYLKNLSGWSSKVIPVTQGAQVSLSSGKNEFAVFRKNESEYFIIENREKKGRDVALPGSGLAIWHVDERGDNSNEQMSPAMHYELSLVQADNRFDLERQRGHSGDSTDLYHGDLVKRFADDTKPSSKWWDGTASNLNIREISKFGETMTFNEGMPGGSTFQTYQKNSEPKLDIPDNDLTGVSDTITFTEPASIASIKVNIDISHTYRGDLVVTLHAPSGEAIVLHERNGGGEDDLKITYDAVSLPALSLLLGRSIDGEWRLHVRDMAPVDKGKLNKWGLEIEGVVQSTLILEESPGTKIPDQSPGGIERKLSTSSAGKVKNIEVAVEITHTYIQDLVVSLLSPQGTTIDLHNKSGGSADNIFTTYTLQTTPALAALVGQTVGGDWKLRVSDHVRQDVGKINSWRLKIVHG